MDTKKLVYTAAFAALCCVATYILAFPFPSGIGYFNVGDVFVLLAGWCLGPWYGGAAAGVGSALADIMSGYAIYAPATLVIKGGVAILAYFVWRWIRGIRMKESLDFLPRAASAIVGELFMVFGYFVFEAILYGLAGGAVSIVGNLIQGGVGALCAVPILSLLRPIPFIGKTFPKLYLRKNS